MARKQATWTVPTENGPKLKLFNSLTRKKEEFVSQNGRLLKWYSCGPTVYDASHMGHARSYISFDILRRVLADYFGYNIYYVMNITDIDDKIIKRARQNYLFDEYVKKNVVLEEFIKDVDTSMKIFGEKVAENVDPDKKIMFDKIIANVTSATDNLKKSVLEKKDKETNNFMEVLREEAKTPICDWLDSQFGATVRDKKVFENLTRFWENEFNQDMTALNVQKPDVLTRVTEYVPEIVKFIEKIIANGYGYESNGSVYFDVSKFDSKEQHHYAKLVPEAFGDTAQLQEGEGDLSGDKGTEKRSQNDFALWKNSKAGEPAWSSPWGEGRPGWHIECSAMAAEIFKSDIDIHTGGVDLKFPHHDNELAQSEAHYDCGGWVKYFLHTGHLTISGCKMSKSLKNFITIKEALNTHTSTQIRFAFLLHSWKDTLDYSSNTMEIAIRYEKFLNEFFLNVKDLLRQNKSDEMIKFTEADLDLSNKFLDAKKGVHAALCDNIDTKASLDVVRELISNCNVYLRDNKAVNAQLLEDICFYITDLLTIFGAIKAPKKQIGFPSVSAGGSEDCGNKEEILMPYLSALADFRKAVREDAREVKATKILQRCDELRDEVLPNLGVRLEDKEGQSVLKLVDKEVLFKEREEKKKREEAKRLENLAKAELLKQKNEEKERQRKINPIEMFRLQADKYSAFDDTGLPTIDNEGKEVSKGQQKKLQKLQKQQEVAYTEYLASVQNK
ncbi:unnamed protein product [Diamesa tonsa]